MPVVVRVRRRRRVAVLRSPLALAEGARAGGRGTARSRHRWRGATSLDCFARTRRPRPCPPGRPASPTSTQLASQGFVATQAAYQARADLLLVESLPSAPQQSGCELLVTGLPRFPQSNGTAVFPRSRGGGAGNRTVKSAEAQVGGGARLSWQRFDVPALSARDALHASPPASPGADSHWRRTADRCGSSVPVASRRARLLALSPSGPISRSRWSSPRSKTS